MIYRYVYLGPHMEFMMHNGAFGSYLLMKCVNVA
jgi:hypothetical protein